MTLLSREGLEALHEPFAKDPNVPFLELALQSAQRVVRSLLFGVSIPVSSHPDVDVCVLYLGVVVVVVCVCVCVYVCAEARTMMVMFVVVVGSHAYACAHPLA